MRLAGAILLHVSGPALVREISMGHDVHMATISIREPHINTGRWIRRAAAGEPVVVTDRGRHVAELRALDADPHGRPLPNREARIRKRTRMSVDSASYVSEMRTRG